MVVEAKKEIKTIRKSYKSQLTERQEAILKQSFLKNQYPKHGEKKVMSEKYGIDPFLLNKWFQRERNLHKKKKISSSTEVERVV